MKEFPDELRIAFLNNYLVNPSGLPGHWFELDLLQEHFNYWIKLLFNSKNMTFDSVFLRECVCHNLGGLGDLRNKFRSWLGLAKRGGSHSKPKKIADINRLGSHYRDDETLIFHRGRDQPYKVYNEFSEGVDKLREGQLYTFLVRTTHDESDIQDPTESAEDNMASGNDSLDQAPDQADEDSELVAPACPVHLTDGVMSAQGVFDNLGMEPTFAAV